MGNNQKMLEIEEDMVQEPVLDFVQPLQQLASLSIAVSVWKHLYTNRSLTGREGSPSNTTDEDEYKWIPSTDSVKALIYSGVKLPEVLKEKIAEHIEHLRCEFVDWIQYHDGEFVEDSWKRNIVRIRKLFEYIAWTYVGRIDWEKTAESIIKSGLLSRDEIYRLACAYCFEDTICEVAADVVYEGYLLRFNFYQNPSVYYWTYVVTGDSEKLNRIPMGTFGFEFSYGEDEEPNYYDFEIPHQHGNVSSVAEYMLLLEAVFRNESAFSFFWAQLPDARRCKTLVRLLRRNVRLNNLRVLVAELEEHSRVHLFTKCGHLILSMYLKDEDTKRLFAHTAYLMRNVLTKFQVQSVVEEMSLLSHLAPEKYYYVFENFWLCLRKSLKEEIYEDGAHFWFQATKDLEKGARYNATMLFLEHANAEQRKKVLRFGFDTYLILQLLESGKVEEMKTFVKCVFPMEEEEKEYRTGFALENKHRVAKALLTEANVTNYSHFVNWAFDSAEEKEEYLLDVPESVLLGVFRSTFFLVKEQTAHKYVEFLDEFLKLCFNGSVEKINEFKSDFIFKTNIVRDVIQRADNSVIRIILRWFLRNEEMVMEFRNVFNSSPVVKLI